MPETRVGGEERIQTIHELALEMIPEVGFEVIVIEQAVIHVRQEYDIIRRCPADTPSSTAASVVQRKGWMTTLGLLDRGNRNQTIVWIDN